MYVSSRWLLLTAASVLMLFTSSARAQFAVIDAASLAQLISQARTLAEQLASARAQLAQAQAQYQAMVGNREDVSLLQSRLNQLTKREADILRYRYGLDEFPVLTLEDIGSIFNLTRERVRQIEAKALKRLRELIPSETAL